MSELTKEWLLKTIAELEEERDATPGIVNEDAAMALATMKIALASLEAEHAGFIVKHKVTGKFGSWLHSKADWFWSDEYEVLSAYTAPPAPVSVPDVVSWEDVPEEITEDDIALASAWAHGFNQCRAAMLRGAEPVTTDYKLPEGWVAVPIEPTSEMQSAAAGAIRFDTTPINKLWTGNAVYKAMIAAAPQQGVKP
ncbi:hypothetical protein [Enterobacter hormaechei]|uniref:hypothetical protein n=1 Tax=Enterobacter hormaechei TaxID=158836 RepID=UPI0010058AF2|nr:hypothetical protein [Enterobacter hormaechei]EKV3711716.1 hypothetical protein [Enterobacter hormaechei]MCC9329339.1 hypothetical protein [Enterobacter hormaechei subsp. steigerwaltii]MCC9335106.1 hypothetical protein [Enterobacter hormaechei subsp. steigerwaltii]MCC9344855.1 hypothetical protein [Enterobacter hormaechei subsp. steigerwaltii]MCC9349522.1 hypothetical protein [Enterobacter hormaechei subsp. steigerwaltii]